MKELRRRAAAARRAAGGVRRARRRPRLELLRAGPVEDGLIETVADELGRRFGVECAPGPPLPPDDAWRAGETDVFASGAVLDAMIARRGAMADEEAPRWAMAFVASALAGEGVGEVFGEAEVEGCCAAIALAPLRAGSGGDAEVFLARVLVSAVHELGHLAGAEHCRNDRCVMFPSSHIADTDRKGSRFCARCRRSLRGLRHEKA
ncbi:MAG TPA: archaemetzincin [Longimicrobium sp.]|nr:archaemetzincin [Longimicrobium sp.]